MSPERVVALIGVPIPVPAFIDATNALTDAYPGCTVGETLQVEVPLRGAVMLFTAVPIFWSPVDVGAPEPKGAE